ncbi:MAG: von Willebrand factor type A domain-containing protein [Alphaproteobacteria bacterium]|nr:von Willebrand factor type A domain-containing protein [Alphaproteobacteria bacterium]
MSAEHTWTEKEIERLGALIDAWDPASGEDLADEVALALDAVPALRERFDQRFARAVPEPTLVPEGLEARVMPKPANRRWMWLGGVSALMAASLSAVVLGGGGALLFTTRGEPTPAEVVVATDTTTIVSERPARPGAERYATDVPPEALRSRLVVKAPVRKPHAEGDGLDEVLRSLGYAGPADGDIDGTIEIPPMADPTGHDGFEDHGVSPFRDTREQPLSTFSIDVDRGSFTWARRQLRQGFLPDPASVRTEEFVNALDYDVPQPESGPFAVQFEGSPSPVSDNELVRITVAARDATQRQPVHLVFLVDTSGSMQGRDRLELVKTSLGMLVEQLQDGDTVAIVTYSGSAGVVLPVTPATDQATILRSLDRLRAGGSTAMGQGIQLAYDLAHQTLRPGHTNRVIIASDGDANVGVTTTGTLTDGIRRYAKEGITLTTLGFGQGNYQDARMEQLANDGDGNYYYVDGEEEAKRIFVDELTSTLEVVARDVKIQVAWNPETVVRYRQVGYENRALRDRDFADDAIDAGEVGAGHTVTALYEVERVRGSTGELATVRLRGKPPGADTASTEWSYAMPTAAMQPSFEEASRDHRMAVTTALFAERLRHSPYVMGTSFDRIAGLADDAARPGHPEDRQLSELIHRAATLSGSRCREVTLLMTGVRRPIWVDENGVPCR